MSVRDVRVTVRGSFDALTPDQRAELVARAAEHDFLHASFAPGGHLSYDITARPFFTFRFLEQAATEQDIPAATARAEATALAWFADRGYAVKNVTVRTEDRSLAPLGARGRKAAARNDR
jgi:hypothetical protein